MNTGYRDYVVGRSGKNTHEIMIASLHLRAGDRLLVRVAASL